MRLLQHSRYGSKQIQSQASRFWSLNHATRWKDDSSSTTSCIMQSFALVYLQCWWLLDRYVNFTYAPVTFRWLCLCARAWNISSILLGCTLGIHSLCDCSWELLLSEACTGNVAQTRRPKRVSLLVSFVIFKVEKHHYLNYPAAHTRPDSQFPVGHHEPDWPVPQFYGSTVEQCICE